jgi:GT2 family glycosyltransferase
MYFEDMDLGKRARILGKKVVFYPDFKIFHKGGESWDNFKLQKKHYYNSMEKYLKKHSKIFSLLITKFIRKNFLRK